MVGELGGPPPERGDEAPVLGFCVTEINVGTMWFLPRASRGDAARKGADQVWKEVGEASKLATDPKDEPSRAGNVS